MKHCEFCGVSSSDYLYRFIAEVEYMIFLNNPNILENNKTDRYVILSDGSKLDYSVQIDLNHATRFKELIPHIFCTEKCEDRFLNKYAQYFGNEIHNKTISINYEDKGWFSPVSFPVSAFEHKISVCKYCNSSFPNFRKHYKIQNIVNFRKIEGGLAEQKLLDNKPAMNPHEYLISDISEENTVGYYYIYKTGMERERYQFCSNECCCQFCLETNSIGFIRSNIEKGYILNLSSHTAEINIALRNVYKYRPVNYKSYH